MSEAIESRARRAVQALVERRISISELEPDVRDFIGRTGADVADVLERIAAEKLNVQGEEDDSYYCYVASDMVRAVAVAVLRKS